MGLKQQLQSEPVRILTMRKLVAVDQSCSLLDAIRRMREESIGCIVLTNSDGRPEGLLTEGIIRNLLSDPGTDLGSSIVPHVSRRIPCVREEDPIARVMEAMLTHEIQFVIVVDHQGRALALTGQKGLMEFIAEHFPQEVMVHQVGQPRFPSSREGA